MKHIFEYVIENFKLFYRFDKTFINYGDNNNGRVIIKNKINDFFINKKNDINPNNVIWKKWKNTNIPFLFDNDGTKEIIEITEQKTVINYDIIGSAFYFLSGWNEYISDNKDEFGRITFSNSIIKKLGIVEIPVVNYYFDILFTALKTVSKAEMIKYNKNSKFVTVLTHDIDTCKSAWLEGGASEFKKKHFLNIPYLIFKKLTGHDLWMNFQEISKIDLSYGKTSSFYFLPKKGKTGNWKNADYKIKSKNIKTQIFKLIDKGHEIGVHGSFGTHLSTKELTHDINKIGINNVIGNRFHFLMFDVIKTVNVLSSSNIKYDTTLGFAEHIGFRRGTCYPFYLYDFQNSKTSDVLEIPLILMDASLKYKQYMNLDTKESLKKVKPVIDEIVKFNGFFTILWHNTFFSRYKYTGWKQVYISILDYCKKNNSVFTSGKDVYYALNIKN